MDGILLVDKPKGISSNELIQKIKKNANNSKIKKIGHTGTLDVLASGLMIVCINSATKISEYLLTQNKSYRVESQLGMRTDTFDTEGKITNEKPVNFISLSQVKECLNSFLGKQEQKIPNYSAAKYKGQPLYKYAIKGVEVPAKSKQIEIYSLDNIHYDNETHTLSFEVECSSGTYIRSLIDDIGLKLDTYALMTNLIRTSINDLQLSQSLKIKQILSDDFDCSKHLIKTDGLLNFNKIYLNLELSQKFCHGVLIEISEISESIVVKELNIVYNMDGIFLGIAKARGTFLKPHKVFNI